MRTGAKGCALFGTVIVFLGVSGTDFGEARLVTFRNVAARIHRKRKKVK
jgi:hypothetical protein